MNAGDYVEAAAAVVAVFGLFAVLAQLKQSRRIAESELVNSLEAGFSDVYHVYEWIETSHSGSTEEHEPSISAILRYVGFFEKLAIIKRNSSVSLETLDDMFGYRFFSMAHSEYIQTHVFYADKYRDSFDLIHSLYRDWSKYRRKFRRDIPYPSRSLSLRK